MPLPCEALLRPQHSTGHSAVPAAGPTSTLLYFPPEFEEQTPIPETKENVLCALGLFVGLVGIVAGVVLTIKGMQKRNATERRRQGPL